jgi:hypothetical protein
MSDHYSIINAVQYINETIQYLEVKTSTIIQHLDIANSRFEQEVPPIKNNFVDKIIELKIRLPVIIDTALDYISHAYGTVEEKQIITGQILAHKSNLEQFLIDKNAESDTFINNAVQNINVLSVQVKSDLTTAKSSIIGKLIVLKNEVGESMSALDDEVESVLIKTRETIETTTANIDSKIQQINDTVDLTKKTLNDTINLMESTMSKLENDIWITVNSTSIESVANQVNNTAQAIPNLINGVIQSVTDTINNTISTVTITVKAVTDTVNTIKDLISGATELAKKSVFEIATRADHAKSVVKEWKDKQQQQHSQGK